MNESNEGLNETYPKSIMITFCSIGLLLKLLLGPIITSEDGSIGGANIDIWSNIIIIFSLITYISLDINKDVYKLIPSGLFIVLLLWQTSISFRYSERINKGNVPYTYTNWNYFINIIILFFIFFFINERVGLMSNLNNEYTFITYIILGFALIIISIQQTILDNFMVDKDTIGE
tara:strand:- start:1934 stop:2458 length:525 start_codon:yes stop_codon:yes gene_type:complete